MYRNLKKPKESQGNIFNNTFNILHSRLNQDPTLTSSSSFPQAPKPQTTSFTSKKRQDVVTDNELYGPVVNDTPVKPTERKSKRREDNMTDNDLYGANNEDHGTSNYFDRSKTNQTFNQYPDENELKSMYSQPNIIRPPNRLEPSTFT